MRADRQQIDEALAATESIRSILRDALLAVYLHGSAVRVACDRRVTSDLLAIVDCPWLTNSVVIFCGFAANVRPASPSGRGAPLHRTDGVSAGRYCRTEFPARAEFIYGEWLAGHLRMRRSPPTCVRPGNTLSAGPAPTRGRSLFGPDAKELLPSLPPETKLRRAMRDALPSLGDSLQGTSGMCC